MNRALISLFISGMYSNLRVRQQQQQLLDWDSVSLEFIQNSEVGSKTWTLMNVDISAKLVAGQRFMPTVRHKEHNKNMALPENGSYAARCIGKWQDLRLSALTPDPKRPNELKGILFIYHSISITVNNVCQCQYMKHFWWDIHLCFTNPHSIITCRQHVFRHELNVSLPPSV